MSTLDESVYEFCDKDIPFYEMTIYTLAMAYAESPIFSVNDEMISDLAQLLIVDEELLKYALSGNASFNYGNVRIKFGEKTVDCTDYFRNTFFASISMAKISQHGTSKTYRFVPVQDFSRAWTDEDLYAKYGLTKEEIAFIESMIKPME